MEKFPRKTREGRSILLNLSIKTAGDAASPANYDLG
jgi:hypothetical protein